jgi:methyl-accepting chemotaxis protein
MLSKFTIKAQLLFGVILSVAIILILGGTNIFSIRQGSSALAEVYEKNVQPLILLQEMDALLKEVRFRMAAVPLDQMSIKGSHDQLKETQNRLPKIWSEFKTQLVGVKLEPAEQEAIEKIDKQFSGLYGLLQKLDGLYAAGNKDALLPPLQEEWPQVNRNMLKPIAQLISIQDAAVKKTYEKSMVQGKKLTVTSLIVIAVSLALMLAFTISLIRMLSRNISILQKTLHEVANGDLGVSADIAQRNEMGAMASSVNQTVEQLRNIISGVKSVADQLAQTSRSISSVTDKVTTRVDVQTDRIMQISAAMEQMSVSVTEISSGAGNVVNASGETQAIAEKGKENMRKNMEANGRIVDSVESSSNSITELSHSIGKISEITKVIKDIADQTNLLALNAAIEAARAGEQGRGFAVVADEVRKLAERTALSTADITSMVDSISTKTDSTVRAMEMVKREVEGGSSYNQATNQTLNQIAEAAVHVTSLAHHIASATQEQSTASEETARNMEEISSITEENASSIHDVREAAQGMAHTAIELQRMVGQFKLAH